MCLPNYSILILYILQILSTRKLYFKLQQNTKNRYSSFKYIIINFIQFKLQISIKKMCFYIFRFAGYIWITYEKPGFKCSIHLSAKQFAYFGDFDEFFQNFNYKYLEK